MQAPNDKELGFYRFIVQVGFSSIFILFCLFKLGFTRLKSGEQSLYWGGLVGNIGYWMPSPLQKKEGDQVAIDSEQTNVFPTDDKQDKN